MKNLKNKTIKALQKMHDIKGQPGLNDLFFENLSPKIKHNYYGALQQLEKFYQSIPNQ